jgi:hypothetical protein
MLKEEHLHLQHVLEDHFAAARTAKKTWEIPDFILLPLHEPEIEGGAVERALKPKLKTPAPHPHFPGESDDG